MNAGKLSEAQELTIALMRRQSITPDDDDCQKIIADYLNPCGFSSENLNCGDVTNTWFHHGESDPLFVFAGHTDVVPTGPENKWDSPPFEPTIRGDMLCGRGAADMKSGVAAMAVALKHFVEDNQNYQGSVALLLTSDEEGPAKDGTRYVVEQLRKRKIIPQWCLVGEPSSDTKLGDRVRIGRRGSLNGYLTIQGIQGHVAYPDKARNPIHSFAPALNDLLAADWGKSDEPFPPTTFQITDIRSGVGANNVIPASAKVHFNFRYAPPNTADTLRRRVEDILDKHCTYSIKWDPHAEPFMGDVKKKPSLIHAAQEIITNLNKEQPRLSVGGGTSDGRFIVTMGCELMELGVINDSIHKVNEVVRLDDIEQLRTIYSDILQRLFHPAG